MKHRSIFFLFVTALLAFTVSLGAAQDEASIVIAQGGDAASLDPQLQNDSRSKAILNNVFDTLIYRNLDLELEPMLATSWEALDDTTWEVTLREGVTFHNGEAFDANDVKFTLERPLNPELGSPLASRFAVIESVDIVDDFTVHINTVDPYPLLPARLSEWFIIPDEYVSNNDLETVATNPVGTGAYVFVEWVLDDRLTLTANEDYWRGTPEIQTVTFRPIPETSTRVAALQAGDADLVTEVPAFRQEDVERSADLDIRPVRSTFFQYVALDGTKNEALADVRVRQAIQYATNVDEIVEVLFEGLAEPIAVPLANGVFGNDPTIERYEYNPERARELLAEAGYPDGVSFALDAPVGRYAQDREVAEALVGQWAQVGIEVDLNINEWSVQLTKYRATANPANEDPANELVEAHFMGWGTSTFDADDVLWGAFARQPNKSNYVNEEVIELVTEAHTSLDQELREENYARALRIIHAEVPWLFLFQQFDIYGVDASLEWEPREDQLIEVFSISVQ